MLIPPKYFITPKIINLLSKIEANSQVITEIDVPPELELNIRRKTTLSSSVFSARIEGNSILPDDLAKLPPSDQKKIEVNNLLKAYSFIHEHYKKEINTKDILDLHRIIMRNIDFEELGKYRRKHEGIFSSEKIVIYHAPPPSQIEKMIQKLLKYMNSDKEKLTVVKAVVGHYVFEKTHPFTDGSGRVGRALMLLNLKKDGYGFRGILPFEEFIDKKRESYYRMLEEPERDITNFIEYMLEILFEGSSKARELVQNAKTINPQDLLLPKRAEIYLIIKDHKLVNVDFLKRRFSKINQRTLRYDLKKLVDLKFIQKLGITRGVYYRIIE